MEWCVLMSCKRISIVYSIVQCGVVYFNVAWCAVNHRQCDVSRHTRLHYSVQCAYVHLTIRVCVCLTICLFIPLSPYLLLTVSHVFLCLSFCSNIFVFKNIIITYVAALTVLYRLRSHITLSFTQ